MKLTRKVNLPDTPDMMTASQTRIAQTQVGDTPRKKGACFVYVFTTCLIAVLMGVGAFAAWTIRQVVLAPYETRIYPNVYVSGEGIDLNLNVGGLTVEEASALLAAHPIADVANANALQFTDGGRIWEIAWSDMGVRLDAGATAQAAFSVGRERLDLRTFIDMQQGRFEVAPVFTLDMEKARSALEALAPQVALPPTDATLRLEGAKLIAEPGQSGRALDVNATLDNVSAVIARLGPDNRFALSFRPKPPQLLDVDAAKAQAEDMLERRIQIAAHDWFTGETFEWTLERETIVAWLRIDAAVENGGGPVVRVDEQAISATLEALSRKMGEARGLDIEEATRQVSAAFEDAGGAVDLRVVHPPRAYTVQAGDDLTLIAQKFGMPPGLIAEANPEIDPDWLFVGQEIVIPSKDILRPYPPVFSKRVEISLAEQRLRAYENDQLLYDWPVSTGVPGSPTYAGEFQVLGKNENAYASQWDLWMPYFIAIYRAGGDTYNGIHALPILSNGQRLWEGALGTPTSYGCIILGVQEAETLFNWIELGAPVTIE